MYVKWFVGITGGGVVIVEILIHQLEQVFFLVSCEKIRVFSKEVQSSGNPSFGHAYLAAAAVC